MFLRWKKVGGRVVVRLEGEGRGLEHSQVADF